MTQSYNTQNRVTAISAANASLRAVGDLCRQSVKQDGQINELIDRLVLAAETIKNEKAEAKGARKVADHFFKANMALNNKVNGLIDLIDRLHDERAQDAKRYSFDFSPAFGMMSASNVGNMGITEFDLRGVSYSFRVAMRDIGTMDNGFLRMLAEDSARKSLPGLTDTFFKQLMVERDRQAGRRPF